MNSNTFTFLLTDRQTNRQTDKQTNQHTLLGSKEC